MKFLGEVTESIQVITEEAATGKKDYYIQGIFMQCDIKNRNGRTYPLDVVTEEVNRFKSAMIATKRALGELGHPAGPTVNLDKVSHMITDLWVEGNNFMGKAKILDTPMGRIVKNLIDEGVTLGVSSRGLGNVVEQNGHKFVKDFFLSTVDIVSDPSGPNAFVHAIMEDKEYSFDANGNIVEKVMDNAVVTDKISDGGVFESDIAPAAINESALLESFANILGINEACWKNYKKVGTKKKGNKEVPNCVPKEDLQELSKATLNSYRDKAQSDANTKARNSRKHFAAFNDHGDEGHYKVGEKFINKAISRERNIKVAADKLHSKGDTSVKIYDIEYHKNGESKNIHHSHVRAKTEAEAIENAKSAMGEKYVIVKAILRK